MTSKYKIYGMTCEGCVQTVAQKIAKLEGVRSVDVSLASSEAQIETDENISIENLSEVLSPKYAIEQIIDKNLRLIEDKSEDSSVSKWTQLRPLFLIFIYLIGASVMLNIDDWRLNNFMYDFMGLFYIVFSFFKLLDLKGFQESFRMYDPLAKRLPAYGKFYPFIELFLGLLFLMRLQLTLALILTLIVLGITTIGVAKSLLNKKTIRCACLGTVLKLPMTEATVIENMIMLFMASYMLFINTWEI